MEIKVRIRQVYGRDAIYPVCEKACAFAKLAGQTTLTSREISLIKALGYSVAVVQDKVAL